MFIHDRLKNKIFLFCSVHRNIGKFKYHMTLREGVCSNRQSTVIWTEGVRPNRHITFVVAKKLNLQSILLYLRYI